MWFIREEISSRFMSDPQNLFNPDATVVNFKLRSSLPQRESCPPTYLVNSNWVNPRTLSVTDASKVSFSLRPPLPPAEYDSLRQPCRKSVYVVAYIRVCNSCLSPAMTKFLLLSFLLFPIRSYTSVSAQCVVLE
jgi:hypothetical protein